MFEGLLINSWDVGIGIETVQQNVDYTIAGGLGTDADSKPNILSELNFKELKGVVPRVHFGRMNQLNEDMALSLDIGVAKGSLDGEGRDRDFNNDNRTGMFSDSRFSSDGSDYQEWNIDTQLKFRYGESIGNYWGVNLGTGEKQIKVNISKGQQIEPDAGEIKNLKSSYKPTYKETKIGLFTEHQIGNTYVNVSYTKSKADMSAVGDWNLRTDYAHPISYKQSASGYGTEVSASLTVPISEHFDAKVSAQKSVVKVKDGYDQVYAPNGESLATKLNTNKLSSTSISLEINFHF